MQYPREQRLWSRYGYFKMWLGKRKIAIAAFKEALKLRPYFKEAMDGLEQAEGRPYIYTYNDTTVDYKKAGKENSVPEYIIDKYYRILKSNPSDNDTRFALVDELIKVNRIEEAYEQLQYLSNEFNGTEKFTVLWDSVTTIRDRIIAEKVTEYQTKFEANNKDREAAIKLSEYYAKQLNYDGAIEVLRKYLDNFNTTEEHPVRLLLARYSAWNYQFESAIEQMNYLLAKEPNNLEYQLFRAQIAVWTTTEPELAHQYLDNVLADNPKNLSALVAKATLFIRERNFESAKTLMQRAEEIAPGSKELESVQNFYDVSMALEEDRKIFEILLSAREIAASGDCEGSVLKYDEYFSKIRSPSKIELMEYADINSCAKNFTKALEIYNQLLAEEYDYDVALYKAKATLWSGDSLSALEQFIKLREEDSTNFDAKLYLAETYEKLKEYDKARELYDNLLATTTDSVKLDVVNKRIGWLPVSSAESIFANFPIYTRISPALNYYSDNQNLTYMNNGGVIEMGLTSWVAVGVGFGRVFLKSTGTTSVNTYFTTFKWNIFLYPTENIYLKFGQGNLSYQGYNRRNVTEAAIRYQKAKKFSLMLLYEKTDAALLLYSVPLVYNRIEADFYKFVGEYSLSSLVKLSGHYSYIQLSDGNEGNDIMFRFGRKFQADITGGYEYLYTNYARISRNYYSPQDFAAHSLWVEYETPYEENLEITLGGKLGYIPVSDFIVREVSIAAVYKPTETLFLSGRAGIGGTTREDTSYNYFSAYVSVFWSIF